MVVVKFQRTASGEIQECRITDQLPKEPALKKADLDAPFDGDAVQLEDGYIFDKDSATLFAAHGEKNYEVASANWPEEALDLWFIFELQSRRPTNRDICVALGLLEFRVKEFLDARE